MVHASGGGAAWCVSDCSVKKGLVCDLIGNPWRHQNKQGGMVLLGTTPQRKLTPPPRDVNCVVQTKKETIPKTKRKNPKHTQGSRDTKGRLTALPYLATVCVRA